jgi:hypothetical protein
MLTKRLAAYLVLPLIAWHVEAKPRAETLCLSNERTIISFQIARSLKIASVCEGRMQAYLVYRFGKPGKSELTYPAKLDAASWIKFEFSGYARGGGIQNDATGDYSIAFDNAGFRYVIYQSWRLANGDYDIGVTVMESKKPVVSMSGVRSTQVGSLTLLDNNPRLPNAW